MKLEELIRRCNEYDGKILFKTGDVLVVDADEGTYADLRNHFDISRNMFVIHPVALEGNYVYYICGDCGMLHSIYKSNAIPGKSLNVGCAFNPKRTDKRYYISDTGQLVKVKRPKMTFAKGERNGTDTNY
jgi:hypothetical protein